MWGVSIYHGDGFKWRSSRGLREILETKLFLPTGMFLFTIYPFVVTFQMSKGKRARRVIGSKICIMDSSSDSAHTDEELSGDEVQEEEESGEEEMNAEDPVCFKLLAF